MKQLFKAGLTLLALTPMLFASCEKEEGPGGSSTIVGHVKVIDYNSSFTKVNGEYSAQDERVYIVFGNDEIYSDDFRTDFDGRYQFEFLTKGEYTIYAMSKDSADPTSPLKVPVSVKVKIDKNNQTVEAPEIVIFD